MTIQRQYVLPNCSLVLEGLSADASNVLSILASAEFKIVGIEQPLTGGVDFFKSVVGAVSAYHQRLLSGLDHPEHNPNQASPVGVEPGEGQYHRLTIKPELLESAETSISQPIDLSTVQLFDMAEAIDQFCADTQTLPDFSIPLAPLARKYVRPEEPLAQRAIPPLLGFGTLAVAALGLFFLPVPELADPENREQQNTAALENSNGDESVADTPTADIPATETQPADDDDVSEPETAALSDQTSNPITDSTQLTELQQQVQQQISAALPSDSAFDQPLRYQVSVAENGDILGYNPLDEASLDNLDNTPLPTLTYIPVDATTVEPVAQFEVTLAADGTVDVVSETVTPETITPEVVPPESTEAEDSINEDSINEDTTSSDPTAPSSSSQSADSSSDSSSKSIASGSAKLLGSIDRPIQDSDRIYELNQELRRSIIDKRVDNWSGPEVRYRVRIDEDGNVTGYEADNTAAEQYAADFKIPDLVQTTTTEQPQLDFLVVIGDNNVVEVNPWDGWP
ncbi:DUF4335 domain-containing protein [Leptolyngbya cf. ectocarpi LEGE 11479]|uniref:DUF4335 domain-containing protein n=1 Tax=Leptolyngbya cf. ectocarpi LEGE 11479 TaxID=1828722 RepID=A0A928ZXL3_LEPEC|nr:DUF4335 domain-containing protein [Leptolyngbya ectocarpi]MBE9069364.1 DUF4335 domain-containing protein [Leptolyngbya cf. ectocarpi LEGE 11479]